MKELTHLSRSQLGLIRELVREKKTRDRERLFVLEGEKPIREVVAQQAHLLRALVLAESRASAEGRTQDWLRDAARMKIPVHACPDRTFETLSDLRTSPGCLAVVQQPSWDNAAIFARPRVLGLYGETLQDPANVGAIVRTALGFSFDALWLSADSADIYNPKVVRATAGSILKLPVLYIKDAAELTGRGCALLAFVPAGKASRPITDLTDLPERAVLAFGNESRGLSDATLRQASVRFHIPVSQAIESLNVAAAAAIAMFHLASSRR